jgi:hypothetical protein
MNRGRIRAPTRVRACDRYGLIRSAVLNQETSERYGERAAIRGSLVSALQSRDSRIAGDPDRGRLRRQ